MRGHCDLLNESVYPSFQCLLLNVALVPQVRVIVVPDASSEVGDYSPFGKTPISSPIGEILLSDYSVNKLLDSGESCDVDTFLSCS